MIIDWCWMRTNRFYFFSDGCWQGERSLSFLQRESIYHREKLPWACLLWHCNKVTLSRPKSLGLRHSLPNSLGLRCSLPRPNEPYSCSVVMTGNSGNTEVFIVFFFSFFCRCFSFFLHFLDLYFLRLNLYWIVMFQTTLILVTTAKTVYFIA